VAAQFGIERRFTGAASWGGAGNACMALVARAAIRAGMAEVVLCYFGVDWGSRLGGPYAFHDVFPAKTAFEKPSGFVGQPAYFAMWANRYLHEYGLDDGDLGVVPVNQRVNALRNGCGQLNRPLSLDDYLSSAAVADPLRVADCCLITDGACAFVVTTAERARDLKRRPVRVLGGAFASEPVNVDDVFTQPPDLLRFRAATRAAERGLQDVGITLGDVDFLELYDCFSISCLLQVEDLGFCGKGEGAAFMREVGTTTSGRLPINTHGGLLAHSYLLGVEHVVEAVRQLRGEAGAAQVEGAEVGLVSGLAMPDFGVLLLGSV
jgi:acetyl-CoA acetyltransferase